MAKLAIGSFRRYQTGTSRGDSAAAARSRDAIEVSLNGNVPDTFKSKGIAHDHKTLVSLTTNPVDVHYDDFGLKAA